jgi:hypothetical protein
MFAFASALTPPDDPMADHLRDELLRNIESLRQEMWRGFDGITQRLDKQNGRIGSLENRESAHHERLGALETFVRAIVLPEPHQSRKQLAITLSLGAGGGLVLIELAKWLLRSLHG